MLPGIREPGSGITEYNWGAEGHINGATAQADIYGIFGREGGLTLANRWTTPATGSPTFNAMKMYRNYDGSKSTFGDMSLSAASTSNADLLSAFAAMRTSDQALTIMIVNKQTSAAPVTMNLSNFTAGSPASVWQLTAANVIASQPSLTVASNSLSTTVPAQSITMVVIPAKVVSVFDPNNDGVISTGDIFYLVNNLFAGGPAPLKSGDANGDGFVTTGDIFYTVNYLFSGGPAPK